MQVDTHSDRSILIVRTCTATQSPGWTDLGSIVCLSEGSSALGKMTLVLASLRPAKSLGDLLLSCCRNIQYHYYKTNEEYNNKRSFLYNAVLQPVKLTVHYKYVETKTFMCRSTSKNHQIPHSNRKTSLNKQITTMYTHTHTHTHTHITHTKSCA